MRWRKREQNLARGTHVTGNTYSDQSGIDLHEDRWSSKPSYSVPSDWEKKFQKSHNIGIFILLQPVDPSEELTVNEWL